MHIALFSRDKNDHVLIERPKKIIHLDEEGNMSDTFVGELTLVENNIMIDGSGTEIAMFYSTGEKLTFDVEGETDKDKEVKSLATDANTVVRTLYVDDKSVALMDVKEGEGETQSSPGTSSPSPAATFIPEKETVEALRQMLSRNGVTKGIYKMKKAALIALVKELASTPIVDRDVHDMRYLAISLGILNEIEAKEKSKNDIMELLKEREYI